jgi:acetyl esterase
MSKTQTMNTLSMVNPEARPLALAFAAFDPNVQPIDDYRADLAKLFPADEPSGGTRSIERQIAGAPGADPLRLLLYSPEQATKAPLPAILFLHASGFISGTPDMFAAGNAAMANEQGALVVAVQYRLAPEHTFPAALQDAYATLGWMFDHAEELGIDPSRIIVMGESAGGGLAAMLALYARDKGEYPLAGQVLIYPMLDPRTGTEEAPDENPTTGEFVWTVRHNRFGWAALSGEGEVDATWRPYLAPALALDLAALPPSFIAVGALDLFLEEDIAYTLRLSRAGVAVEAHIYPASIHGFNFVPGDLTSQYESDLSAALRRMLSPV